MGFRKTCALTVWLVLVFQYVVLLKTGELGGFAVTTLTYFGYFTILTNILVALAFSVSWLSPNSALARFFLKPNVRAAIALYILVVAVVYYLFLAVEHNPTGLSYYLNICLHFIFPVLYVFDWLFLDTKKGLKYRTLPMWTVFPILYGVFNLVRGVITGFYPYPFLDISLIGAGGVMLNMVGFVALYYFGGAVFIWLGHRLTLRQA